MLLNYTTVSPRNHKSLIQNSLAGLTLKSFFNSNSDLSVKKPLNDRILNAMKTAAILEDNETQNHFIFESSLLRPNAWPITANRLGWPFHELRDRLLEFQKIKKNQGTHFSHTLKPLEHGGKNRFSKYQRFLCYFGSQSFSHVFCILGTIKLCDPK